MEKVISGDQIGLAAAGVAGIPTGGVAPKGYMTEIGPSPQLASWGLTESYSSDYRVRTRANVVQ